MGINLNEWEERDYHGTTVWFISAVDKWCGDGYGNEWMDGLSIFVEDGQFSIFEDDGYGTGAFVASVCNSLDGAKAYCESLLIGRE